MLTAIVALCLPAVEGQNYNSYELTKRAVLKGDCDTSLRDDLDSWIATGGHGKPIQSRGQRTIGCFHQLKLVYINNCRDSVPDWSEEAMRLFALTDGDAQCNDIGGSELIALKGAAEAEAERARRLLASQREQQLVADCQRIVSSYSAKMPLDGLSCGGDPSGLESAMAQAAASVRTRLVDRWTQAGETGRAGSVPRVDGVEPSSAFADLARFIDNNASARTQLWAARAGQWRSAHERLPAGERQGVEAPTAPATDAWIFWQRYDELQQTVDDAVELAANFERTRREALDTLASLPTEAERCKSLGDLCASGWAASACRSDAASSLTSACDATEPAGTTVSAMQAAIAARRTLAAANWDGVARALDAALQARAGGARDDCADQPTLTSELDAALAATGRASLADPEAFIAASRTILKCEQGAAFAYGQLVAALDGAQAIESDCVQPLAASRSTIDRIAQRIRSSGKSAAQPQRLAAAQSALGEALACVADEWRQAYDGARAAIDATAQRAQLADDWLGRTDDPRYAAVRKRTERLVAAAQGEGFSCDWGGAEALGEDPESAVAALAACRPTIPSAGEDPSCDLMLVAALAAAGEDFASGGWSGAGERFEQVEATCDDALTAERRQLLDYFQGYVAWKLGRVPGDDGQLMALGYDPEFDDAINAR